MRAGALLLLLASCSGGDPFQDRVLATIPEGTEQFMLPSFSPDGRHVAYIAKTGKEYRIVKGDWKSRPLDYI